MNESLDFKNYIVKKDDINYCHDWFQATFDFYQIDEYNYQSKEYLNNVNEYQLLIELITKVLKFDLTEVDFDFPLKKEYKQCIALGENIKIFLNGSLNADNRRINLLEITGSGCRDLDSRNVNYYDLFKWCKKNKVKPTRIDNANDVFTNKYFDIEKLCLYIDNNWYSSPFYEKTVMLTYGKKMSLGKTLYIGSYRGSNSFICIYDKNLELQHKGYDIESEYYFRVECRFKKERAEWYMNEYINSCENGISDNSFVASALYKMLDFKDPEDTDLNVARRKTVSWWSDFINGTSKAKFNCNLKVPTLKTKSKWFDEKIGRMLLQFYLADEKTFVNKILKAAFNSNIKLEKKDLVIINDYLKSQGLEIIDESMIQESLDRLSKIINYIEGE